VSTETRPSQLRDGRADMLPVLRCSGLCVAYGDVEVLRDVDLDVGPGQLLALLGASGSGKSTLLHAVAGLVPPSSGEIWLDGRLVADSRHATPPEKRDVGLVFQNFALWPHVRVIDTVAYPLRRSGSSREAARGAAHDLLERLGIAHLADQRPAALSGGEQQRVGLARALARNARLYLLDEPTAHLDTHLRTAFQESVLARRGDTGAAIVYATHDAAEALGLADRVALVDGGRLIQVGSPGTVYAQPVSPGAAALTGPCSMLTADVNVRDDETLSVDFGQGAVSVRGSGLSVRGSDLLGRRLRRAQILVRPDWVAEGGALTGRVTAIAFRGPHTDYRLESSGQTLTVAFAGTPRYAVGATMAWQLRQTWVFDESQPEDQPSATMAPG
jgi:ABC-type sugar transport system ATPase subunit